MIQLFHSTMLMLMALMMMMMMSWMVIRLLDDYHTVQQTHQSIVSSQIHSLLGRDSRIRGRIDELTLRFDDDDDVDDVSMMDDEGD